MLSLAAAILVIGVMPTTARAYNLWGSGCEYAPAVQPSVTYRFYSVGSTYQNAWSGAAIRWNNVTGSTTYWVGTSGSDPNAELYDSSYAWDGWAEVDPYGGCDGSGWDYDEVVIRMNTRTMASLTTEQKKRVMVHEAGHAYGLHHVSASCSGSSKNMMSQGTAKFNCSGNGPYTDDINGWEAIYE
jgi:hypothetical protein